MVAHTADSGEIALWTDDLPDALATLDELQPQGT
jgi:hypothetical protein